MGPQERKQEAAERIEEMAHILFGLPRDARSRAAAEEMAGMLERIASVPFGKEEEPIMPRFREKEGGAR